jgi:hypothetical protein
MISTATNYVSVVDTVLRAKPKAANREVVGCVAATVNLVRNEI